MKMTQRPPESPQCAAKSMTRRAFLTVTAAATTGGLLAAGCVAPFRGHNERNDEVSSGLIIVRAERLLMGTTIRLAVAAPEARQAEAAIAATYAAMERLIALFDYRLPQSALAILNRTGRLVHAPAELTALLTRAQAISALSDGAFDVTVQPLLTAARRGESDLTPYRALVDYRLLQVDEDRVSLAKPGMAVTLDGVAKGRVIDEAVAVLRGEGFGRVLVEAGGDLAAMGRRADDSPWRLGIAHPRAQAGGQLLTTLALADGALATSGDYMNYFVQDFSEHHIVDPRTGHSPTELAGVTVMAPTVAEADALSTAFMVLGAAQGRTVAAQLPAVEALFVTKALEQLRTPGFPKMIGV